jgi:hypothetical protein
LLLGGAEPVRLGKDCTGALVRLQAAGGAGGAVGGVIPVMFDDGQMVVQIDVMTVKVTTGTAPEEVIVTS